MSPIIPGMNDVSKSAYYVASFSPLLLEWLSECDRIHPKCSSQRSTDGSPDFLPTRLIDLGPSDSQSEPRLVLGTQLSISDAKYVALSHKWPAPIGDPTQVSTARWGTLQQRLNGIDLDNGPVNFRFASDFCRRLKVRYLWIDCYCINQGDVDDWETESSLMDKVYARAYCTIAINREVTDDSQIDDDFSYNSMAHPQQDAPPRGWLDEIVHSSDVAEDTQFLLRAIKNGPLGERAWCFQERMLSPRVLYFLDGGVMLWECCTFIGITGWPSNLPSIPIINQDLDSKGPSAVGYKRLIDYDDEDAEESNPVDCPCASQHQTLGNDSDSFNSEDTENEEMKFPFRLSNVSSSFHCMRYSRSNSIIFNAWYAAVSEYSRRTLTRETDRPYALRGYINQVIKVTGSECHYGLLTHDAARGLLWAPDTKFGNGRALRHALSDIPSWSWLNARRPVKLACPPTAAAWHIRDRILRSLNHQGLQREPELPEIGSPQIFDIVFSEQGKMISFTGLFQSFSAIIVNDISGYNLAIYDRQDIRAALHAGNDRPGPIAKGAIDFLDPSQVYSEVTVLFVSSRFGLLVEPVAGAAACFRRLGLASYAGGDRGPLSRLKTNLSNHPRMRNYQQGVRIRLI